MTFLALLNADNFSLSKVASTHGGEYAGACPWCGGNDRFRLRHVRIEAYKAGAWKEKAIHFSS